MSFSAATTSHLGQEQNTESNSFNDAIRNIQEIFPDVSDQLLIRTCGDVFCQIFICSQLNWYLFIFPFCGKTS